MLKLLSDKYNNLILHGDRCYAFTGLFRNEDITNKIQQVELINSNNGGYSRVNLAGMTTVGAITSGIPGAIVSSFMNKRNIYAQFFVIMLDSISFIVETNETKFIEFFIKYIPVKKKRR
jgi:hypothetical protein